MLVLLIKGATEALWIPQFRYHMGMIVVLDATIYPGSNFNSSLIKPP